MRNGEKAVAALHGRGDRRRAHLAPTAVRSDLNASRIGDATTGARTARTAVTVESGAMSRPSEGAAASVAVGVERKAQRSRYQAAMPGRNAASNATLALPAHNRTIASPAGSSAF